jgi:hypothetical protein
MQVHVANEAFGLGDALVVLWVVQGLVDAGYDVVFYTHHSEHFGLFTQPNLEILPIEFANDDACRPYGLHNEWRLTAGGKSRIGLIEERVRKYLLERGDSATFEATKPRCTPVEFNYNGFVPGKTVLVFPHSNFVQRAWHPAHWSRVVDKLQKRGEEVLVLTANSTTVNYGCLTVQLPFSALFSLIPQAKAVFCVDSGPLHLAALGEQPTYAVFAMTHPAALLSHYKNVTGITPTGGCSFCHAKPSSGYIPSVCSTACSKILTVSPEQVIAAYEKS